MNHTEIKFSDNLKFFLPPHCQDTRVTHHFKGNPSIKDMVESFGIPHTEVIAISANSKPVDFTYLVQDQDQIMIFSHAELDLIPPDNRLQTNPLHHRFILDTHLGKLAAYLRGFGFDCSYFNSSTDSDLAELSNLENRILLSRDRGLLMRKIVQYGYYVRQIYPRQQVLEVVSRYNLFDKIKPFTRCVHCNGLLKPVSKEVIINRLQPETQRYFNTFSICSNCDHIYWKGSHYQHMLQFINAIKAFRSNI